MDGDIQTPAVVPASVSSVLDDDDLLRKILLRLGFPNLLVRAALVSKRWLLHASDPAFLRRFRERHPPRLLGFCVGYPDHYQFVQIPLPPELAALSRRAASSCDAALSRGGPRMEHCRNGRLLVRFFHERRVKHSLLAPLLAGESEVVLPPTPPPHIDREEPEGVFNGIFLPEDGSRNGITLVSLWKFRRQVRAEVYVLGSGGWGVPTTAVTEIELRYAATFFTKMLPPVHGKIFMVTGSGFTLGLDMAAASFFTLELPAGVLYNYMLSCAEGSGIYLVTAEGFQLSVWLNGMMGDSDGADGWLLVDTFCIREAYSSAGHNWVWTPRDADFLVVAAVGDNAEFVFLEYATYGVVLYVHLRSRVVEKVYEQAPDDGSVRLWMRHKHISPLMMSWPPIFPALNGGHNQEQ